MSKLYLILPAAMLAAAAPALAQAEEETVVTSVNHGAGTTTRSIAVSHADLDLTSGRGYARLQHRVADAASRVCDSDGLWTRFADVEFRSCYQAAIANAMTRLPGTAAGAN